jgi:hypothetical protein
MNTDTAVTLRQPGEFASYAAKILRGRRQSVRKLRNRWGGRPSDGINVSRCGVEDPQIQRVSMNKIRAPGD